MTFRQTYKDKVVHNYHCFYSDTFDIQDSVDKSEIEILDGFINSDYFTDDFHFGKPINQEHPNHGPFYIKGLTTKDFKKFKPSDIESIINNFGRENILSGDLETFKDLWKVTHGKINDFKMTTGTIFHLDKFWFDTGNKQLTDWEHVFIYSLVFIFITEDKNKLISFDFCYD